MVLGSNVWLLGQEAARPHCIWRREAGRGERWHSPGLPRFDQFTMPACGMVPPTFWKSLLASINPV